MKKSTKLCSLIMAAAMIFGMLAGCSSSNPSPSNTPQSAPSDSGNAPADNSTPPAADGDEIEIGIICPLSNTGAATNGWLMAGYEAGTRLINENGGLDGHPIHYTLYDPESDASTLKQRLTDIKNSGAICAICNANDALAPAAAQWAAENKFPVFMTSNVSTEITLGNYSDYAFNMGKNAWGFAKILAMHCVGQENIENFVFIGTDGAATIDAENFLIYEGKKINPNFEMLASYRVNFNDTEFSNIIAAATTLNPQMVLQQGGGPNFVSYCQQASLFNMFEQCDVYNDLVTDASTNQPLIEGDEFPYGKTHGVFLAPFWDVENMDADLQNYFKLWSESEAASKNGYYFDDRSMSVYYIWTCIRKAVESGADYTDPQAMTEAIGAVSFSDFNGDHKFRVGLDNQWETNMYYGTSAQSDDFAGVAICPDYEVYKPNDYLPTAAEMKQWAADHGYSTDRF